MTFDISFYFSRNKSYMELQFSILTKNILIVRVVLGFETLKISSNGGLDQMVERVLSMHEAQGSIPWSSIFVTLFLNSDVFTLDAFEFLCNPNVVQKVIHNFHTKLLLIFEYNFRIHDDVSHLPKHWESYKIACKLFSTSFWML